MGQPGQPAVLTASTPTRPEANVVEDDQSRASEHSPSKACLQRTKAKLPPKKRMAQLKRDTKVSFEEMKRLMRVYGPTKCLRNRTPKDSDKSTKILSVKRKFYRWFPDLHERFVLQTGGWYKPVMGHEEEMKYREELRKKDQEVLAAKRNARKNGLNKMA